MTDQLTIMREALEQISDLSERPFTFPADWSEQIAGCPDCQRFKDHPLYNGICDTHRKPLYARERHDENERKAIFWRAKKIADDALYAVESLVWSDHD